jgi:hypothetical protein
MRFSIALIRERAAPEMPVCCSGSGLDDWALP